MPQSLSFYFIPSSTFKISLTLFPERTCLLVCPQYSFDAILTVIVLFLNLYCQKMTTHAFLCTFDLLIWISEAQWQSYYFFGIEFFIKNGQCTPHVILGRSLIQILQSKNFIPILVENSYITQSCLMVHAPQRVASWYFPPMLWQAQL